MGILSVGVIGAGGMGTRHAMNLHGAIPGARVAGIYDIDQDRAGFVASQCGDAKPFSDPHALINDPSVDAVMVVSPDNTHAEFVLACLRAGKPVLSEKPLATTIEDAQAVVEAELAFGRRMIGVGFMRRFDPQHVAVKQAIAAGDIGRPFLFKGVHRNPMPQPNVTGSIVLTNSAIHDLDSTRWLLGQDITEVWVRGVRTHESFNSDTLDMLLLQMTLTNECLATVECSVAVEYGYEVLAEVVGERGSVITTTPADALIRSNKALASAVPQSHLVRFQNAFLPEVTDWIDSLQTGKTFSGASAWDGYMATLTAMSCIESLESGKPARVPTPETPELYR